MPKKNMTIDDLAGMVQRGFTEMGQRIDGAEKRLGNRIDGVEGGLTSVEKGSEKLRIEMHDEFRRVHEEIENIKKKLDQLSSRTMEDTDATIKEVFQLKKRIEILERNYKELKSSIG